MKKRVWCFFFFLISGILFAISSIYFITTKNWLQNAAVNQHFYKLDVAKLRANIYDCNKKPLVNKEIHKIASVIPSVKSMNKFKEIFSDDDMKKYLPMFSKMLPFTAKIPNSTEEILDCKFFDIPKRYSKNQICPHLIGYIDESFKGITGIEKCFNDFLGEDVGEISVNYKVDARGGILGGSNEISVLDTSNLKNKGIVTTIDERIQEIVENAMKEKIKKGAAIVLKVPDGEIKACVSMPCFSPCDLKDASNDKNSPLINRAFSSYNLGSIFKLVTAALALEENIPENESFNCKGTIDVDGMDFGCFRSEGHGSVDMKGAISKSCNGYFIKLSKKMNPEKLIKLSRDFGFGESFEVAPDLFSERGNLPNAETLNNQKASFANFSFGQGELLATPLQVACLLNTIVSNGRATDPRLIEGFVDESLNFSEKFKKEGESRKVISKRVAKKLKGFMLSSLEEGTSFLGKSKKVTAGAKTSTAQTGIKENGKEIDRAWFAGFFPYEQPKYVVVVLAEDGNLGGGKTCGPVFSKIVDEVSLDW